MWAWGLVAGLVGLAAAYPKRLVLALGVGVKSVTRIILAFRGHTPASYAEARVVSGQVISPVSSLLSLVCRSISRCLSLSISLSLDLSLDLSLSRCLSLTLSCGSSQLHRSPRCVRLGNLLSLPFSSLLSQSLCLSLSVSRSLSMSPPLADLDECAAPLAR